MIFCMPVPEKEKKKSFQFLKDIQVFAYISRGPENFSSPHAEECFGVGVSLQRSDGNWKLRMKSLWHPGYCLHRKTDITMKKSWKFFAKQIGMIVCFYFFSV